MNHTQADASKHPYTPPLAAALAGLSPGIGAAAGIAPAPVEVHRQLALQQVAIHAVNLAVARWTIGDSAPDVPPASTRSRWYAETHGNFTAWLSAGGFAQSDADLAYGEAALLAACRT